MLKSKCRPLCHFQIWLIPYPKMWLSYFPAEQQGRHYIVIWLFGHSPAASRGQKAPGWSLWSQQIVPCRASEQVSWAATCGPGWAISCLQAWRGWQCRGTTVRGWMASSSCTAATPLPALWETLSLTSASERGLSTAQGSKLLRERCRIWATCLITQLVTDLPKVSVVVLVKYAAETAGAGTE